MPNYRYKIIDSGDVILSQDEHEFVQDAFEKGQTLASLRGGSLGLGRSAVKIWTPTKELTELQEEERQKRIMLGLPTGPSTPINPQSDGYRKQKCEFYDRMKWEHPPACFCKSHSRAEVEKKVDEGTARALDEYRETFDILADHDTQNKPSVEIAADPLEPEEELPF